MSAPHGLHRLRVGNGFDVHRWSSDVDRTLVLGGVVFPDTNGLVAHSDGDAVAHAVIDAMLGAAAFGDIGSLFPDTDPAFAGADSLELLRATAQRLSDTGWTLLNADCTVVLDAPKLAPFRSEMEANLSAAAGAPVTVKGKRTEGVTALAEGLQCFALALMVGP